MKGKPTIKTTVWQKDFSSHCYGVVTRHTFDEKGEQGFYTYDVFCDNHPDPVASSLAHSKEHGIQKAKAGFNAYGYL